jgi:hypothetical protein
MPPGGTAPRLPQSVTRRSHRRFTAAPIRRHPLVIDRAPMVFTDLVRTSEN